MTTDNCPHVLCVDDEPHVLEGLKLQLHRRYEVLTATGAREALAILGSMEYPAVIMSDMKMPGMDGANFLSQARRIAPNSVRILLTGQANLQSAISAVNDGQIFRFLIKPCPPNTLLTAVDAAAQQHRLLTAERVLVEQTLHGSIKAMMDVLAITTPLSFGRGNRVKQLVTELGTKMVIGDLWQAEMAAMLRQLGYVAVPQEVIEKAYYGETLTESEEQMIANVPRVTEQLLANIPRIEAVRQIIAGCERPPLPDGTTLIDLSKLAIRKKAQLLRVAGEYDILETRGITSFEALATMSGRSEMYDAEILQALIELRSGETELNEIREVPLAALMIGMTFADDVKTSSGLLLAPKGYQITASFLERARNFQRGTVKEPLRVLLTKPVHEIDLDRRR